MKLLMTILILLTLSAVYSCAHDISRQRVMVSFKESRIAKSVREKSKTLKDPELKLAPYDFNVSADPHFEDLGPLRIYDNDVYVNSSGFIVFQRPYKNWAFPQPVDRFLYDIDLGYAKGWWENFLAKIE